MVTISNDGWGIHAWRIVPRRRQNRIGRTTQDRKSTRLNSSHSQISYAVFCLKKKNNSTAVETTLSYDQPTFFWTCRRPAVKLNPIPSTPQSYARTSSA